MVPEFQKQSSKNIESLKETVERLVKSLPEEVHERYPDISSSTVLNSLQYTKIPGLVALPFLERKKFNFEAGSIEESLAENILFKEDLTPEKLFKAIADKIASKRNHSSQALPSEIQDYLIAGLFGITSCSFPFPLRTLPCQQVRLCTSVSLLSKLRSLPAQNSPRSCRTGPAAGTGKTWMLMESQ